MAMNRAEVDLLVGIMAKAYPWIELDDGIIAVWNVAMAEVPFGAAQQALHEHILTEERPPAPARIRTRVLDRLSGLPPTDQAWALVDKSRRAGYPGMPSGTELPAEVLDALREAGGMHALRNSSGGEEEARFRRRFDQAYAEKRSAALRATKAPTQDDAHLINGFGATAALTDGQEGT
jgi:hypothetical protein